MSRRELAKYAIDRLQAGDKASQLAKLLAASLLASGRAKEAELLMADIFAELEERGIMAKVSLTSANKLSAELAKFLVNYTQKTVGVRSVISQEVVDPHVIGGFKLETANWSLDKTIHRELSELKGGI